MQYAPIPVPQTTASEAVIAPWLQEAVQRELGAGERILWIAQPVPSLMMRSALSTCGGGVLFTAFACFWTSMAYQSSISKGGPPNWPFIGFGCLFILFGLSMLFSPLTAFWKAGRTVYCITDRRGISIKSAWRRTVRSFTGQMLTTFERREDSAGRGDIIFEREASKGSKGRTVYREVGFLGLPDTRLVARLLHDTHTRSIEPSS